MQYHADQDVSALRAFWAQHLDISPETIAFHQKTNSGQLAGRRWRSVYGVMAVRSADTQLRSRLEAWIQIVRSGWLDSPDGV